MIDEIPIRDSLPKKRPSSFSLGHLAILLGLVFATLGVLVLCSKGFDLIASKIWPQPQPTLVVSKLDPTSDKQRSTIEIPIETSGSTTPSTQTTSTQPPSSGAETLVSAASPSLSKEPVVEQSSTNTTITPPSTAPTAAVATAQAEAEQALQMTTSLSQEESVSIPKQKSRKDLRSAKKVQHHNPNHYTVQIMGMYDRGRLRTFISKNHLAGKVKIYQSELQGKPWYVAVYGEFASREEALKAIPCLPTSVQEQKPWARSFASLQRLSHVAE